MPLSKTEKARFIKFSTVGISGTIIDFGIFNLLIFLHVNSMIASIISFITAVFNNFYWNRHWTYPESKIHHLSTQLKKFFAVSVTGLLIRTSIYSFIGQSCINFFGKIFSDNQIFSPEVIGKNFSLGFVIIIVLFWNYLANRFWTYKDL